MKYTIFDSLSLGERDKLLKQLDNQIEAKRNLLIDTHLQFKNQKNNDNEYLREVKKDYHTHFTGVMKQKDEQLAAMNILHKYLNDIVENNQLMEDELMEAKKDVSDILHIIKHI